MKIYIDTEFNDFQGELISIALVAKDGNYFYSEFKIENEYSEWVMENVVPHLGGVPTDRKTAALNIQKFLSNYDSVELIADWPEDIQHFMELVIIGPGRRINLPKDFKVTFNWNLPSTRDISKVPHNSLYDAMALADSDTSNEELASNDQEQSGILP